jgi:hypothetical protein
MFSRWIVTNITSAGGTLHCRKTRIPCRHQLVICGQYTAHSGDDGMSDAARNNHWLLIANCAWRFAVPAVRDSRHAIVHCQT